MFSFLTQTVLPDIPDGIYAVLLLVITLLIGVIGYFIKSYTSYAITILVARAALLAWAKIINNANLINFADNDYLRLAAYGYCIFLLGHDAWKYFKARRATKQMLREFNESVSKKMKGDK